MKGLQNVPAVAVMGLLSAGVYAYSAADALLHVTRHGYSSHPHSSRASYAALEVTGGASASSNPFMEAPLVDFMTKFDIPKVHGSGILVDLSNDKEVDGRRYREAAGKCPVFGKNIELYQPLNNAHYKNDFLDDIPTKAQSEASGNPLPGGFNNNFKLTDGSPYSPMSGAKLGSYSKLTAKTPLGKCAQMSYMTTASSTSTYRYPFVYDTKNDLCYFLFITMQRLMGERYCSNRNNPPGLTWYCFKPKKSASLRPYLVYGSSYAGENPDAWETKCPNKAITGAVFGVWENGACVEHRHRKESKIERVSSKEDCWALAFNNPGVASDHPVTNSENIGTWGYYFPSVGENQPKSGGIGVNYASFYGGGLMECALSKEVPTCFVPLQTGAAYTALGGLDEEPLPACTPSFPETRGSCDPKTCRASITTCQEGKFSNAEVECLPDDGSKCEANLGLIIGLAVGGIVLLALIAGGVFMFRRKPKPLPPKDEGGRSEYVQEEAATRRRKPRASDLVQQAEPSFWEEADAEPDTGDNTQVLIDQEY